MLVRQFCVTLKLECPAVEEEDDFLMAMEITLANCQMMVSLDRTPHVWTQEQVLMIMTRIKIIIII